MTTFKMIFGNELSEQHFDEYPVWSEFYEYDELEEIVSWGVDCDWLMKEWQEKHSGSEHCVYTVLQTEPLPERMRIYVKADVTTATGIKLKGYVMGEDAFGIGVFVKGQEFFFTRASAFESERDEKERLELQNMISDSKEAIFPLTYKTDFKDCEGKLIAGEFA